MESSVESCQKLSNVEYSLVPNDTVTFIIFKCGAIFGPRRLDTLDDETGLKVFDIQLEPSELSGPVKV